MASRDSIENLKNSAERTIQGLKTKMGEFRYNQTKGLVKPDLVYSIYFTPDKREVYITGLSTSSNPKIMDKIGKKSVINTYHEINKTSRQNYPQVFQYAPSDEDYDIGIVTRYFTRIANDTSKPFFEISVDDFNDQNNLFTYISTSWTISGDKNDVLEVNQDRINTLPNGLKRILFPLQLWRPSQDSSDSLEKKLERLRK